MTRILLIPVTGTIMAFIAISLARHPRGEAVPPEPPPFDWPDAPEHAKPPDEEEEPPTPPAPVPQEFHLMLEADGAVLEGGRKYASIDDLVKEIGDAMHTLVITNGDGVTKATLDDVEVRLRDRFKVVKVYSAPEAPPDEDR